MATKSALDEETAKKVFRQVEFYFSDSNLPKDQFLKNTISESEDGLVSLALICSFSRMKGHLGLAADVKLEDISDDVVKSVADALKTSQSLKFSDDGKKVGRKVELAKVDELIEQLDSRTIAASPLPYDVTREDVESLFAQHVKVNSVRLPTHVANKKVFCGTALIEFSSEEDVEKMLKQKLEYAGVDLEFKSKKEFDEEREKQSAEAAQNVHATAPDSHKSPPEPSYPKGLIVAFALRKISYNDDSVVSAEVEKPESASEDDKSTPEDENKENINITPNPEDEKSPEDADEKSPEDADEKSPEDADVKDEKKETPVGRYNYSNDKDNKDIIFREDLKAVFEKFGTIKFIDFSAGVTSGFIRFEEEEASQKARAAAALSEEGGLVVKNYIATLSPVTGEAEKEYWSNMGASKERFRDNRGNRGGRGGRFSRGRGGKHGRFRDNDQSGRPSKARKVAA